MAKKLSPRTSTLLAVTVALLGFGLVMVWSASSALAQERHGSAYYFLVKQALWGVDRPRRAWSPRCASTTASCAGPPSSTRCSVVSTLLLILVLFLKPVNETHRWIRLGALCFQPAELAKLSIVLFLAYHIERRAERVNEFVHALPGAPAARLVRLPRPHPARPRHRLLPRPHRAP